jgi:adenosine deaminase/adenosine deaminase CECR1
MPKGGDLHTHLTGAVYAESYLRWAEEQNLCVQMTTRRIIACPDPLPSHVRTAAAVRSNSEAYDTMIDALSIRNLEHQERTGRQQFFATFGRFRAVYLDRPDRMGDALAELVRRAAAQHVQHVEIIIFDGKVTVDSIANTVSYTDDWAELRARLMDAGLRRALRDGHTLLDRAEARADSLLGCQEAPPAACQVSRRYRMHAVRVLPPTTVFARLLYGIERAKRDPRVVAIDMVAPEDHRIALRDYHRHMRMLRFLRDAAGTDATGDSVHVGLHAGELTLGLVPPRHLRDHVRTAITVGEADRIGHGVDIGYEARTHDLLQQMREREIAVEVLLTSNEVILGVDGAEHPLPDYLAADVPVVLATDDEGVARTTLTHEYVRAARTYDLSYHTLKTISRNSLHYAFLNGESLWASRRYQTYVDPCQAADPADDALPSACRTYLDTHPKAKKEWALERAFHRFEARWRAQRAE